jgi:N-acetylmuramoyl-L-alanine amidase
VITKSFVFYAVLCGSVFVDIKEETSMHHNFPVSCKTTSNYLGQNNHYKKNVNAVAFMLLSFLFITIGGAFLVRYLVVTAAEVPTDLALTIKNDSQEERTTNSEGDRLREYIEENMLALATILELARCKTIPEPVVPAPPFPEIARIPGVPRIMLDAGHGGEDDGCHRAEVDEKDINLDIALLVEGKLVEMGYQVIMTRSDDRFMTVEERVERANYYQADVFISIHQNAYEGEEAEGIEVWYEGGDTTRDSKRLAQVLRQHLLEESGAANREIRPEADFYVTSNTIMPACLVETGFLSNHAERNRLLDPSYQQQLAQGITDGINDYLQPKIMYLTFDDGPSGEKTERILDILSVNNVKATFFVIGEYVRKYPATARRIVEEGHAIGIHCDIHNYGALYQSVDSYIADFEQARQTVWEVTGVESNLFRFPGGSVNAYNKTFGTAIANEMIARGYTYFDWNAGLEDASSRDKTSAEMLATGLSSTLGRKKIVFLAHDTVENTVVCLDELLDGFSEYKMEVLTPEVEPIRF